MPRLDIILVMSRTSNRADAAATDPLSKFLKWSVYSMFVVPTLLDFFFYQTLVARISRVIIFISVSGFMLLNSKSILTVPISGVWIQLSIFLLFLIGTLSSINNGGVATPNYGLLALFLFLVSMNNEKYTEILRNVAVSVNFLIAISAVVIILKLNPREYFASSVGYPVYFDVIGIPGRNYGIFAHPNVLGSASAVSFIFLLYSNKNKLWTFLPIFAWLKCGSRTALIAMSIGLIFYLIKLFVKSRKGKAERIIETPSVIVTFIVLILFIGTQQFLALIKELSPDFLTGRISIWQTSQELVRNNSLLGLGWGWEERAISNNLLNVWAVSTHNQILEIAFSAGYLGLFLFSIFLAIGVTNFQIFTQVERSLFVSFLVTGISESYVDLQYPTIQTYLFFLLILRSRKSLIG